MLNQTLELFYHYQHKGELPLKPTRKDEKSKDQSLWVTSSGIRLAAVIHDIMRFGPLEGDIKLEEPVKTTPELV